MTDSASEMEPAVPGPAVSEPAHRARPALRTRYRTGDAELDRRLLDLLDEVGAVVDRDLLFEILVSVLQAYIFTLLTAVYISGALHPEH